MIWPLVFSVDVVQYIKTIIDIGFNIFRDTDIPKIFAKLMLACLLVWSVNVHALDRLALVIGNSAYINGALENPKNDAADITEVLKQVGFQVTHLSDLNQRDMIKSINAFTEKLKETGAIGFFYYAGHGVEVNGVNYILPLGMNVSQADELEFEAVPIERILAGMESARNGMNIIVIDACRNNPFRQFRTFGGSRGLVRMQEIPKGSFIASSTASGDLASDGEGRNSPYTKELLKHILTPGLSLEGVFKQVRVGVLKATDDEQTPWETSSLLTDFFFKPAEALGEVSASNFSSEERFWVSMDKCGTNGCYQSYIDKYPSGDYISAARAGLSPVETVKASALSKFEQTKKNALAGDAGAQYMLGAMYDEGSLVTQSYPEAVKWYRLAAEQGHGKAQSRLGDLYRGAALGAPKNDAEAMKWDRLAAEQGNAFSQFKLGRYYYEGDYGLTQNYAEALKWFKLAAAQGYKDSQANIGYMYEHGLGVPQSNTEALKWYKLDAAQQTDAFSQHTVDRLEETIKFEQTKKKAAVGDQDAQSKLGFMYHEGKGVTQSYPEAVKWFRLAAKQGNPNAQNWLGSMYRDGKGVTQSNSEAVKWYRLAADHGYKWAQESLGHMYLNGKGVPQNYFHSVKWFRLAAEQGLASAQYWLGFMYENNAGVSRNDAQALKWYRLAAAQSGHYQSHVDRLVGK